MALVRMQHAVTGEVADVEQEAFDAVWADKQWAIVPGAAAGRDGFVTEWQPRTSYKAGEFVVNPSGELVSALTDFQSGPTYNAANWSAPTSLSPSAAAQAYLSVVAHGAAAGTTRTAGAVRVLWVGTVEPSSGTAADLYLDTATGALYALVGSTWTAVAAGGGGGLTTEQVQDIVGAMVLAGTNVTATYDDAGGTLTIAASGLTQEQVEDFAGAMQTDSSSIDFTYDDAAGTITAVIKTGAVSTAMLADGSVTAVKAAPLTISTQTANYVAVLGDADTLVRMDTAGASTFTVPPNSSVAFAVGRSLFVSQKGAGQVTLTPGSGVTLNSRGGALKTAGQYAQAVLTKVATDEWLVGGDVTT